MLRVTQKSKAMGEGFKRNKKCYGEIWSKGRIVDSTTRVLSRCHYGCRFVVMVWCFCVFRDGGGDPASFARCLHCADFCRFLVQGVAFFAG